jgi:2-oxoglutarate dehydrogenase E2 component (dihydrolipoamide succinyltransferase)
MMTEIRLPGLADAASALSILRWFKRTGDPVTLDEPLLEINTDKGTHEIHAPVTGVLSKILLKDGASVEAGAVLGTIRRF